MTRLNMRRVADSPLLARGRDRLETFLVVLFCSRVLHPLLARGRDRLETQKM